jgi:hypothetical protein
LLGELGRRREVVLTRFRIYQVERLREVDLLQLVAAEPPDVGDLQGECARQLALNREIDHMRIGRLHVIVETVRNFETRPKRIVWR